MQYARRKMFRSTALVAALFAATPASAAIFVYTAALSGANESPANASPATGNAVVTVDTLADTVRVQLNFSGLTSPTNNGHIHCCSLPGANSGVAVGFQSFPLGGTSGTYDFTYNVGQASTYNAAFLTNNGGTSASAFAALQSGLNSGLAYVNIHTTQIPGGEIRGNLALAVPEPAIWGTMLLGFGLIGAALRRPAVKTRVKYR